MFFPLIVPRGEVLACRREEQGLALTVGGTPPDFDIPSRIDLQYLLGERPFRDENAARHRGGEQRHERGDRSCKHAERGVVIR